MSLTGPGGLLKQLTKTVLETALDQELTEHLGHDKHGEPVAGNVRNGTRAKTVLTKASGQVPIKVPRDRAGTFEPQIVGKRQRRLTGVDETLLSLYAMGLTTGEISAHFAEIYAPWSPRRRSAGSPTKCSRRWPPGRPGRLDEVYAAAVCLDRTRLVPWSPRPMPTPVPRRAHRGDGAALLHDALRLSARLRLRPECYEIRTISVNVSYTSDYSGELHLLVVRADRRAM